MRRKGWKLLHLLPVGATECENHYPTFTVQKYVLSFCQSFFSACWVCSFFRNPPNSDMDYKIFDVAYVIILVRAYTHWVWAPRQRVSTTFVIRKYSQNLSYYAPDGIRNQGHWCHRILSQTLYQLSHPVTPCGNDNDNDEDVNTVVGLTDLLSEKLETPCDNDNNNDEDVKTVVGLTDLFSPVRKAWNPVW